MNGVLRLLGIAALLSASVAGQGAVAETLRRDLAANLQTYCLRCHGDDRAKGGVRFAGREVSQSALVEDHRFWSKTEGVLAARTMPPKRRRQQPTDATRQAMVDAIRMALASARERVDPGRPVLRRLNRRQFDRTVRDLFHGLPFQSAQRFPKDPQGYGFDTTGDVLFASPMLVEKYLDVTAAAISSLRQKPDLIAKLIPHRPGRGEDPAAVAEKVLRPFLTRAFRRPPTDQELASRVGVVTTELARRDDFIAAVLSAFRSALLAPQFLFRVEKDRATQKPWALPDYELAVRLSYFLWSTMPDAKLLAVAAAGELQNAAVLRREIRRMLGDPRSRALADDFGAQWLGYRDVLSHAADVRRFGKFKSTLRRDLFEESARFFDHLVRADRPVTELLDADYGFLNRRLAEHYGIPGVRSGTIRRVDLPDRRRGGVLGMGSVLASTSYPLRTSPVLRGKWILENLLDEPPAPPPPDAGTLPSDDKQRDNLTLRQRLERHRRDRACASCHAKMDPLGFALEPFDAIGRWRTENHGRKIDALAALPDGTKLDGPIALKDWLLSRKHEFVRTAARKLLVYALGRQLTLTDEKVVTAIVRQARDAKDRTRTLIEAVAMSYPFRHRRSAR